MLAIPRWHRVRHIGPRGMGQPMLLNRFRGHRLYPCAPRDDVRWSSAFGKEWLEPTYRNLPVGLCTPKDWLKVAAAVGALGLGAYTGSAFATGWLDSSQLPGIALFGDVLVRTAGGASNITVSTTNIASGNRILFPGTLTLNNIYFFCVTTPTNNTVQYSVSAGSNSLPTTPATPTVLGPTAATTASSTWTNVASLSSSLTGGTYYWVWVSDSAAPQAANAVIRRNFGGGLAGGVQGAMYDFQGASTTDFWATAGARTFASVLATQVLVFSDGTSRGYPFTALSNSANNTNEKGLFMPAPTASFKLFGAYAGATPANALTGLNVYSGATAPSGTGDVGRTTVAVDDLSTLAHIGFQFASPVTLNTASGFHVTFTFSAAATTSVQKYGIGTGIDDNLRKSMFFAGAGGYSEANGTTNWANDDITGSLYNSWPLMMVEIEDLVAAAGGGGMIMSRVQSGY